MNYDEAMFIPPWYEWSNDFINTEKWDQFYEQTVFETPGGHERLPPELARQIKSWKRPSEIFGADGLSVQYKEEKNDVHDLLTVNQPLLRIKVYRWILYHIMLYTSRCKNKWPVPWHPSSLVFSRCKVEMAWNKKSKPEYNPFGKYWLKLFCMGKFRMICVSDHLPVSHDGTVLLPLCENNKILWLPLLVKGLLRIFSLTEKFEQFNTITCLTGWSCIRKNCQQISERDVWLSILSQSSNAFLETVDTIDIKIPKATKSKIIKPEVEHECFPIKTTDGDRQCYYDQCISNCEVNPPNSVLVSVILSPNISKWKKIDSMNRYAQPMFFNNIKYSKNKLIPTWKTYRWTKWAIENNIIKKHELGNFIKLVNICAPCINILEESTSLMKALKEYKVSEDEMIYELDFLYLEPFVTHVEFFMKSSQTFQYIKPIMFQNKESVSDTAGGGSQVTDISHRPVYLFFESLYCESILFTLSVCKNYTLENNALVIDGFTNDNTYINVEQFLWYETKQRKPLLTINSKGMPNDIVKIEPGINVLKVWGELPAKYSLVIESTVDFSKHWTLQAIYEKLTNQPKSLSTLLTSIKQMCTLLWATEPYTIDRGNKLLKLYSMFMPPSFNRENELKKNERYWIISKHVRDAIVDWIANKYTNDLQMVKDIYKELQQIFQTRTMGRKQIVEINEKLKQQQQQLLLQLQQQQQQQQQQQPQQQQTAQDDVSMGKKSDKPFSAKKSVVKSKSVASKHPVVPSGNKSPAPAVSSVLSKVVYERPENLLEILYNVLNADKIALDEYYLKNDLLNYIENHVIYDENTIKHIDQLLAFRLDLNTHSISELAPTIIQYSYKSNINCAINLTLFNNDSRQYVKPMNPITDLYMVKRTASGYTLLGWFSEKNLDVKHYSYKLSFLGRPYQILHSCGMQGNRFYKYSTTVCNSTVAHEFVAKHERNKFIRRNNINLLARVFLHVENAALYTIYCHIEHLENLPVEIRVVDKNINSTVFASVRTHDKIAMIPTVFLNPHYNRQKNYSAENLTSVIFAIEIVLIQNIEANYNDTQDELNEFDWTISCIYDPKITDISLENDNTLSNYQFVSSIPHQNIYQRPIIVQKNPDKTIDGQTKYNPPSIINEKNYILPAIPNYHQLSDYMMINPDLLKQKKLVMTTSSTSVKEESYPLKMLLAELAEKQTNTEIEIKKNIDLKTALRQPFMDEAYNQIVAILNSQRKSNINMNQSSPRQMKKNKSYAPT